MNRPRAWLFFLQKKRGTHRTIPPTLAFWGELGIFCLILIAGVLGVLTLVARIFVPYWRAVKDFRPQFAVVRSARVVEHQFPEGLLFRPEILVSFQAAGREYATWAYNPQSPLGDGYLPDRRSAERVLSHFQEGQGCIIHYDPKDPSQAFLFRDLPWWTWVILFVPVSLVILGMTGIVMVLQAGKEQTFLGRMVLSGGRPALPEANASDLWPTVPRPLSPPDSPGVRLPIRLPLLPTQWGHLLGWLLVCLLWNGVAVTLFAWALTILSLSRGDWSFLAFTSVLVGGGAFWTGALVRQAAREWRIGPTIVEISEQPLLPGSRYQIYLAQLGKLRVNRLTVYLVCEERAIFREGTETRRESRQVARFRLFRREAFEVHAGVPFEAFFDFQLPFQVMHSFRSPHNEIAWMIVVENVVVGLPPMKRYFPVVVYPPHSGKVSA
ncbi:MAG: hypothetical protein NZ899_01700 [Thermoguttaceae bacterium]|nr:hypothetical protein [Thermoguttaceae bacterium]MDW8078650.1 hypothetical protein [Thermoguttaceae bacterium]